MRVPRWAVWASLAAAALGIIDAAYLTYEHFTASTTLACSDSGTVNCLKVTTSVYSHVLGVPVTVVGLAYFVVMTALCLPVAWESKIAAVGWIRVAGAVLGVLMVFYLIWVELFRLDAICLWCTAIHAISGILFVAIALGTALREPTGT